MSATVPTPLRDIAKVVRSKNAGPFEITLDIVFKNREDFDAGKGWDQVDAVFIMFNEFVSAIDAFHGRTLQTVTAGGTDRVPGVAVHNGSGRVESNPVVFNATDDNHPPTARIFAERSTVEREVKATFG